MDIKTEAATKGVLYNHVFLKISENAHKNARVGVSFLIMWQAGGMQLF